VTATEAEQNRRRGLAPWWRVRSWSKDLDTLTRLHKALRAMDDDAEQEPLSAPALLAPPAGLPAPQDLMELPQNGVTQQHDAPELPAVSNRASYPAAGSPQETAERPDASCREADVQELPARQLPSPEDQPPQTPAPEAEDEEPGQQPEASCREADVQELPARQLPSPEDQPPQTPAPEAEHEEPRRQPDAVPEQAAAGPDPAIVAIKETFRYVADAGDKAVGFFYGQLFLRQPHLRQLFPPAMDQQRDRLFRALGRIVESLSTPDEMAAYLSQLGRDHRKYQVEPEMYEAVGASLLATLRAFARDAFTSEAQEAWTQVYTAGSSLMIKAAEEDAARSPASWTAEVVSVDHRTDDIAVLTIAPDQALPFIAGQHLTVQTPRWPRVWRSYSIACMPRDDGLLTLHVKAVPGGWVSSALVRYTSPGSQLVLGPPLGTMTLERATGRDLVCVAGGTGLSPVKAIVEQAVRESAVTQRRIYLYYGARRRHELYDLPDLWRLEDAYSGFELIPVTSDDPAFDGMQGNVGRVAARYMPHGHCDAYVAGPPEMVRETIRVLARAGLERERIHFDDALLAGKSRSGTGT
jgi:NAD(P)H-flavin reductase/hemoglobin-like flavoprotein